MLLSTSNVGVIAALRRQYMPATYALVLPSHAGANGM